MFKKRKSTLSTIAVIGLLGILSFKDTGIFVKDFVAIKDDGSEISFKTEEIVNISRESDREYLIVKENQKYQVPKDNILITEKDSKIYIVKATNTKLMDKPNGKDIKTLNIKDKVILESLHGEYGLFNTGDNLKGYILLENLDKIEEEFFTIGKSKVHKTIKGENNTYYVLAEGETVLVKDFKNGRFIIVNEDGKEFQVPRDYIDLRNSKFTTSRSGLSRRTSRINSVVQNAYKALGKSYSRSGIGPNSYDCSGLTYSLYLNHAGIELNRTSIDQSKNGFEVKRSELIPGDLLFFKTTPRRIGHVGLYIGDGNMIHASSSKRKVIITPIDSAYYKQRYVTARRIIK